MSHCEKILFVDDEQQNRMVYNRIFAEAGYEVVTARNSSEAFDLLQSSRPDLLLVDANLGNESGFDILKTARKDPVYRFLYIVIISAIRTTSDDQSFGLESGADGYIVRPIEKRELLARIEAFMRHKRTVNKLIASELILKKIINHNPDSILIVDNDARINFANPSAESMFGRSEDELKQWPFGLPVIRKDFAEINIVKRALSELVGEMRSIEIEWDGKQSYLTSIRDITQRKEVEANLCKSLEAVSKLSSSLESAREEERLEISRNLHDDLGQLLTALKMELQMVKKKVPSEQSRTCLDHIENAISITEQAIKSVQSISADLRPPLLDDLGLFTAIEQYCKRYTRRTEMKIHLELPEEELNLVPEKSISIMRIIQELLTNIARHANATKARLNIQKKSDTLVIKLTDDGSGISPESINSSNSLGIIGIREKVTRWNGTFNISGNPTKGTSVNVTIPV